MYTFDFRVFRLPGDFRARELIRTRFPACHVRQRGDESTIDGTLFDFEKEYPTEIQHLDHAAASSDQVSRSEDESAFMS